MSNLKLPLEDLLQIAQRFAYRACLNGLSAVVQETNMAQMHHEKVHTALWYNVGFTWKLDGEYEPRIHLQSQMHRTFEDALFSALLVLDQKYAMYCREHLYREVLPLYGNDDLKQEIAKEVGQAHDEWNTRLREGLAA
jgi:hypothetical protein